MSRVEEVARAILKARFYDCEPEMCGHREETFWEDLDPDHIIDAHDEARTAIEAMREPTPDMRRAFWNAEDPTDTGFRNAWAAAIDAALSEEGR